MAGAAEGTAAVLTAAAPPWFPAFQTNTERARGIESSSGTPQEAPSSLWGLERGLGL